MAATPKTILSLYEARLDVTTPEVAVEVLPNMDLDPDAIILRVTDNREVPEGYYHRFNHAQRRKPGVA